MTHCRYSAYTLYYPFVFLIVSKFAFHRSTFLGVFTYVLQLLYVFLLGWADGDMVWLGGGVGFVGKP